MHPAMSLYLDAVRFTAALVVFLGHLSGQRITGGLFWQLHDHAMFHAVSVFFVLSGYVIAYVTFTREEDARAYGVARTARIASVALPALVIAYALDRAGIALRPDLYTPAWGFRPDGLELSYLLNLFFLGTSWFEWRVPGSMLPWWSLNYEVWFYVLFGVLVFARGAGRVLGVVVVLLVMGPVIALFFPVWLLGVAAFLIRVRLAPAVGLLVVLATTALIGWIAWQGLPPLPLPPALKPDELAGRYAVGLLFAAHLVGFAAIAPHLPRVPAPAAGLVRWAAGATFTLYLLHVPIAQFLSTLVPWPPSSWATRAVMLPGTLALIFAIAAVTERRKDVWRRGVEQALDRIAARQRVRP